MHSGEQELVLRSYEPADEAGWLRCRALAFLDSAYFDDTRNEKEQYAGPSIELVAAVNGEIVGLIDVEYETKPGTVCSPVETGEAALAGMIWHVGVHPDYRRRGVAGRLLQEAIRLSQPYGIQRLEAWTREDPFVNDWYQSQGFQCVQTYYHVYPTAEEIQATGILHSTVKGCHPMSAFCHYLGNDQAFLRQFSRVHECRRYDLVLNH